MRQNSYSILSLYGILGLSMLSSTSMAIPDIHSKSERGLPMRKEGDGIYVDSNGRRYKKDEKGTVRRIK